MEHNAKHLLTRKVVIADGGREFSILATSVDDEACIFVYLVDKYGRMERQCLDDVIFCKVWDEGLYQLVPAEEIKE